MPHQRFGIDKTIIIIRIIVGGECGVPKIGTLKSGNPMTPTVTRKNL